MHIREKEAARAVRLDGESLEPPSPRFESRLWLHMSLSKSLNLPEPRIPHLQHLDNGAKLISLL